MDISPLLLLPEITYQLSKTHGFEGPSGDLYVHNGSGDTGPAGTNPFHCDKCKYRDGIGRTVIRLMMTWQGKNVEAGNSLLDQIRHIIAFGSKSLVTDGPACRFQAIKAEYKTAHDQYLKNRELYTNQTDQLIQLAEEAGRKMTSSEFPEFPPCPEEWYEPMFYKIINVYCLEESPVGQSILRLPRGLC